jgi:competence protein ComEC
VISCGRANPYGHPVPQVMKRYEEAQSAVFRTDRDGQIEIQTDGNVLAAKAFNGRSEVIR